MINIARQILANFGIPSMAIADKVRAETGQNVTADMVALCFAAYSLGSRGINRQDAVDISNLAGCMLNEFTRNYHTMEGRGLSTYNTMAEYRDEIASRLLTLIK